MAICGGLAILMAGLAVVQYRWSTRVASADAQREKEHLNAAAALFAEQFNGVVAQAVQFLQTDARNAVRSGNPAVGMPELFNEIYYADVREDGKAEIRKRGADGRFEAAAMPDWAAPLHCGTIAIEQPPAMIVPAEELMIAKAGGGEIRVTRTGVGKCFVARIDIEYLRRRLFPRLIGGSFGGTAAGDYDFAVASRGGRGEVIFGAATGAELRTPFFSLMPDSLMRRTQSAPDGAGKQNVVIVERVESTVTGDAQGRIAPLIGPGIWELRVAHKGMPLEAAFEQTRRRNLLWSLAVEALLLAAIVFLVVAVRRIERLADEKMRFVAGVSHELRTPVSAIAMLARNQADGLVVGADRVRQYGELIHQQSRRLNEMVEQTLQYAGIGSGLRQPANEMVDPRRLIGEAVGERRGELERAGFEVELALGEDLPQIRGDAPWLRAAIDNLLSNAVKHAGSGRWLRVSAEHDRGGKEVRIAVEDRGAGIDPAEQPEIFEPFARGKSAIEAQIPGSGLGLSLVRSAAEAHHGSVTLESEPGRGSRFTLHLPV